MTDIRSKYCCANWLRWSSWLAVLALAWLGLTTPAHADDQADRSELRVAIVVVTALNLEHEQALQLADRLARELETGLALAVVDSTRAHGQLGAPPAPSCEVERACVQRVAGILQVRELLFLTLVRMGDETQVNLTWADAVTGDTAPRAALVVGADEGAPMLSLEVAQALLPNAAVRPAASESSANPASPADTGIEPDAGSLASGAGSSMLVSAGGLERDTDPGRRRHLSTGVWVAGGLSAVALVGGLGAGALALRADSRLSDSCEGGQCQPGQQSDIDARKRYIAASDILMATAAAAGLTAALLYAFSDKRPESTHVGVAPQTGGISVSLGTRF